MSLEKCFVSEHFNWELMFIGKNSLGEYYFGKTVIQPLKTCTYYLVLKRTTKQPIQTSTSVKNLKYLISIFF